MGAAQAVAGPGDDDDAVVEAQISHGRVLRGFFSVRSIGGATRPRQGTRCVTVPSPFRADSHVPAGGAVRSATGGASSVPGALDVVGEGDEIARGGSGRAGLVLGGLRGGGCRLRPAEG